MAHYLVAAYGQPETRVAGDFTYKVSRGSGPSKRTLGRESLEQFMRCLLYKCIHPVMSPAINFNAFVDCRLLPESRDSLLTRDHVGTHRSMHSRGKWAAFARWWHQYIQSNYFVEKKKKLNWKMPTLTGAWMNVKNEWIAGSRGFPIIFGKATKITSHHNPARWHLAAARLNFLIFLKSKFIQNEWAGHDLSVTTFLLIVTF